MQDFKKPYYSIYQRMGCAGEIYVNDVPVFSNFGKSSEGPGGVTGDIPINHALLKSGTHKIVGKIMPRHNKQSITEEEYMSLDFYHAEGELDRWKETRAKFHPRLKQPWNGLSENVNYPSFEITTEIEVNLPFELDGWQNSIDLLKMDEKDLLQQVISYYTQIHAVLRSHNASKFLELSQEKMKLQEQAFYFSEERKKSFRDGAFSLFNQKLEVLPLNPAELKLDIIGYGKLVRLLRLDGGMALQYKSSNPEQQENIEFDIKLHMRTKEKGFSII
ncbi:hypothetical protein [Aquimarina sp. MMG016]|uniref:hypothetical protein n=1 Tax=Aquimarina sp. MMG016 TaxID=2822690 RepID=UPI001B3A2290|nr:hypothetical protein [Aquimarina sp. MMG016]MBQ4821274.1 hypothetical protein [Aquimarina sp. MMG016]